LCQTPEDLASLVAVESPVRETLVHEYPFVSDDVGAMSPRNKFPGLIAHQGPVLYLYSRTSIWIDKRDANRGWDLR
jgi:hypothetical protein